MYTGAILAGLISGILSPIILSWLQHRIIWKKQKTLEMKHSIFLDAVRALSCWACDAMDPGLQSSKVSFEGTSRKTELRPETVELMERSKGMVQAFFSKETYGAYETALHSHISIDNVPNEDFEGKRTVAIVAMASELGIAK